MNDTLLRLVDHMRWADGLVADALVGQTKLDNDTAEAVRLFAHIAAVEHLWYARILGEAPRYAVWPTLSSEESRGVAAEHANLFERLVRESDDADLRRVVEYRNSAGKDYRSTVADIITHTAVHGEHHRGQIALLVRAAGREPPYTDFIQYSRRDQG